MPKKYDIEPLGDRVILHPLDDGRTEGGLHLANPQASPIGRGQVMAAGLGKHQNGTFVPSQLQPGDLVLYNRNTSIDVPFTGGERLLLTSEESIIAKLTESEDQPSGLVALR